MPRFVWIPEAPGHPGLYANKSGTDLEAGRVVSLVPQPSTMDPHCAQQFLTMEGCQAWCDANPRPVFTPVEHGFGD